MKRTYIITLLLSLCSLFTYAQDSFFDKFADMDGVTSVYISKAMLCLMPDMKTEGVNIGEVASKLDHHLSETEQKQRKGMCIDESGKK